MSSCEFQITFQPQGKKVYVLEGTTLLEAAGAAGIILETPCGAQGVCGKCKVRVVEGLEPPTDAEEAVLDGKELEAGYRLACQTKVRGSAVVEIPDSSLPSSYYQILSETKEGHTDEIDPSISKKYVELAEPTMRDDLPDLERIQREVGPFKVEVSVLRKISGILRKQNFQGTAVLVDHRLIDFEKGDTESSSHAVVFDIGTTTLAAVLLDLTSGRDVAETSRLNPQIRFGDDLLSRILYGSKSAENLEALHQGILVAVNAMIEDLAKQAGISRENIYEATFAGNTAMQQILCGVDCGPLGLAPFAPVTNRGLLLQAADFGIHIHPEARAYVFPVIGGFVGGDAVAGVLATGLCNPEERPDHTDSPILFVDIGTNGEIVLHHDGETHASSTAAGPAFEGAKISQGMRAGTGAIDKIVLDNDVQYNVIGNVPPIGICGSALIDVAAEMLRKGVIESSGRILNRDEAPKNLPESIRTRILDNHGKGGFVIAKPQETRTGEPIVLTQKDVRELQLATGAIRAGIRILLRHQGLETKDLQQVYVAGGFGNYIRRENAQRIGLIPTDLRIDRVKFSGNTALAGAKLAQISRRLRKKAEDLAAHINRTDLSSDPNFQMEFAEAMLFPVA